MKRSLNWLMKLKNLILKKNDYSNNKKILLNAWNVLNAKKNWN
jgi:hypothetical protein